DGLLLVESRYALINVYLLAFGLLSQWLLLMSSQRKGLQRWAWLTLSGLSFGATVAVKWNGLGFLLGIYLFWAIAQVGRLGTKSQPASGSFPLADLSRLSPLQLFVFLPLVGAVLYRLVWIPHLQQNPEFDFWQVHQQMYGYHQRVGNGPTVHPYCSAWFSWPPMLRPVSYFYQVAATSQEPVPMVGPPMAFDQARYVYSVYAIGNPFLWWFASIAFLMVFGLALAQGWRWWQQRRTRSASPQGSPLLLRGSDAYIPLYLTTSYAANLLPWLSISRCAFLYHYMPAYLFSSLGLAWLLHRWLRHPLSVYRRLGLMIFIVCMLSFLFWLPLYLGLPLSPREWQWRMWFPSWI
ncbi:MAG TPA: phospholipid carrier-dependent glycosyltransferase, partial [Stenomitos sp.]